MSRAEITDRDAVQFIFGLMAALFAPSGWHAAVFCALVALAPDRSKDAP